MPGFSDITIVNVDGRKGHNLMAAQNAIFHSASQLPGSKALLLSPERPNKLLNGIQHIEIAPLDYFSYNIFMIYNLHQFIETPYALIVQDDGWVFDGALWKDDFFSYDYIGAPVHLAKIERNAQTSYVSRFEWVPLLDDPSAKVTFAQNGGFCLRSRKLLEAPSRHQIPFILPPPKPFQTSDSPLEWQTGSNFEDVQLCIDMRASLEALGLKFAPVDIARAFSIEHYANLWRPEDLGQIFGHHSKFRKLKNIKPLSIRYTISAEATKSIHGENYIIDCFKSRAYQVDFAPR